MLKRAKFHLLAKWQQKGKHKELRSRVGLANPICDSDKELDVVV